MWILDFDCCRSLSMDDAGIEQACAAFLNNDPFYPKPGSDERADQELWSILKQGFLEASQVILRRRNLGDSSLAEKLIQRVEEVDSLRSMERRRLG